VTFGKKTKSGTVKYVPDEFVNALEGTAILKYGYSADQASFELSPRWPVQNVRLQNYL
jgi:hypothetical protein